MKLLEIKNKIESDSNYSFLRENEHLGNNIILLTVGGSHAYGTDVATSDLDIRGIAIERKKEILGLSNFEVFENREADVVIYGLKKIIDLLLDCNPNTIEILGTRPEQIFMISEEGRILKENINLFLSQKAVNSFGGYATQQLKRIENALARDEYPQQKKETHILQSIERQMKHIKEHYKTFTKEYRNEILNYLFGENIKLYIDKSDKEEFENEIFIDIKLKKYPLRDFKSIQSEMLNVVKDYGKLNHRNNKKSRESLLKHSLHLIRLLIMSAEILEGKGVNTYRSEEKELLLDIRNGKYTYDEIFEMVDVYDERFRYAKNNTSLPSKPDYKKVEELLISLYEKRWYRC